MPKGQRGTRGDFNSEVIFFAPRKTFFEKSKLNEFMIKYISWLTCISFTSILQFNCHQFSKVFHFVVIEGQIFQDNIPRVKQNIFSICPLFNRCLIQGVEVDKRKIVIFLYLKIGFSRAFKFVVTYAPIISKKYIELSE